MLICKRTKVVDLPKASADHDMATNVQEGRAVAMHASACIRGFINIDYRALKGVYF